MILPDLILRIFEKEVGDLLYGKVSVSVVRREDHCHYEFDKHFTIPADENSSYIPPAKEKNG